MITILPAVQHGCKRARRYIRYSNLAKHQDKRIANRRHRRALNRVTRGFLRDPELFYSEDFFAPSLSPYDIW
jgi:hypothetical protein